MSAHDLSPEELISVRDHLLLDGVEVHGDLEATLIAGGRSNLTFKLDDGSTQWVLRMPPRAGRTPSAHDVAREFTVTSALHEAGLAVPPPVSVCRDETVIGCDFAVTRFVVGTPIQSNLDLGRCDDTTLEGIVDALVKTLASLHRIDHVTAGLEDFGRPDGYAARQLKRWSGQWDIVGPTDVASRTAATELIDRLTTTVPEQRAVSVVHGDYRIDNTLLDLTGPRPQVAAVVDWELSTIGDPVADVATMCAYRHPSLNLVLGFDAAWSHDRIPSVSELARRYSKAGGVELRHWDFHLALAYFKIAAISAGISHRHRASGAPREDDTAADAVLPFLHTGLETLLPRSV